MISNDKFNVPASLNYASTAKNKVTTPLIAQNHQDAISADNKDTFPEIVPIILPDQIQLMGAWIRKKKLKEDQVKKSLRQSQK